MNWSRLDAVLDEAMDAEPASRETLVRDRLGDDPVLEQEALSLLAAMEESSAFLSTSPQVLDSSLEPGARFGAWKITGSLGAGGMGEVYAVERADGEYRQKAALKLMRPLPSAYWGRFQVERQIVAELDHPGVPRLLDGGLGAEGRPFMVIEYVDGVPIDVWARRQGIDARRKVALILEVCDAVSHANAKLVVHRDIKPSNILVTEEGRTRLIDFGVARLLAATDPGKTATPVSIEYAAPELLEGGKASVMTDVYGLAATLFELLTGRAPIVLDGEAIAIAVRRIAEENPPRLAQLDTPGLGQKALIRDLDAILGRALRKEPSERYATVDAFAQDLKAATEGRPVTARLGERGYVLRRFIRRRRWPIAAAAAVVLSLSVGLGMALDQASQAQRERDMALREQARLQAVQQYLYFMLRDAAETGGPDANAEQILDNAAAQVMEQFKADPVRGGPVMRMLGELYFYLNDYEAAEPLLQKLMTAPGVDPAIVASAAYDLAQVKLRQADTEAAGRYLARAQGFWSTNPDRWRSEIIDSRLGEARLLRDQGKVDEAIALLEANLPGRITVSGPSHRDTGTYYNDLGVMMAAAGRRDEAISLFRSALGVWQSTGLSRGPDALNTLNNLAALEVLSGRPERAEPLFAEALSVRRQMYGASAATAALISNYGKTIILLDRPAEAVPLLEEATAMAREHAGVGSLHYASALAGLSEARLRAGSLEAASALSERGLAEVKAALGPAHPAAAVVAISLGRVRGAQGRKSEAVQLLNEAESGLMALGPAGASQIKAIDKIRTQYALDR